MAGRLDRTSSRGRTLATDATSADDRDQAIGTEQIERQFDRVQALLSRVDSKVNAVFAIVSAEIALASLAVPSTGWHRWSILILAGLFVSAIAVSLHDLYKCTFPHFHKRDGRSLVYFADVAELDEVMAIQAFSKVTTEDFRADLIVQTWRTSVIATDKFRYLRRATQAALVSLLPWVCLLAASSWIRQ